MADDKKYYYLKLKDNFFDSDSMIILESMPDGYLYSNILLKLFLRSLRNNGKLMFNGRIPYNSTILAQVTRHSVGVIEKALQIFKDLDLIEVLENGAIYMCDIHNFIGQSSTEADRKRLYRLGIEKEKAQLGQMSGRKSAQKSDKNPPEIELELELKRERELEEKMAALPLPKKEPKEKKELYLDFIKLTKTEFDKLINEYGESTTKQTMQRLNDYIGSKGAKYKSHYFTIRSWIRKDKEKINNQIKQAGAEIVWNKLDF